MKISDCEKHGTKRDSHVVEQIRTPGAPLERLADYLLLRSEVRVAVAADVDPLARQVRLKDLAHRLVQWPIERGHATTPPPRCSTAGAPRKCVVPKLCFI